MDIGHWGLDAKEQGFDDNVLYDVGFFSRVSYSRQDRRMYMGHWPIIVRRSQCIKSRAQLNIIGAPNSSRSFAFSTVQRRFNSDPPLCTPEDTLLHV